MTTKKTTKKAPKKRTKRATKKPTTEKRSTSSPKKSTRKTPAAVISLVPKPPKMLGTPEVSVEAKGSADVLDCDPPDFEAWIEQLRADHLTTTADVRISMAADALKRAYRFETDYLPMMLLVDRHLKGAVEADRAAIKRWIQDLKKRRDKGDRLVGQFSKLGGPRIVKQ